MNYFVEKGSVVREIWGQGDTILLIFAGAAAEFALNKAVDWLYFTGRLPADPLGRLFSTVTYARDIVFSAENKAESAIDRISSIHSAVEKSRERKIPDWAYRDVLFMLIDYSIRSYEVFGHSMDLAEKKEVFEVFLRVGSRMQINGLPRDYDSWVDMRENHIINNLENSYLTGNLFKQYRKHLGPGRYLLLKEAQKLVVPIQVRKMLGFSKRSTLSPFLPVYRSLKGTKWEWPLKKLILPEEYVDRIKALDIPN
ncbi:oxygenase MpaB family protein [Robertkochia aurantiaca]|uniref:oxygenase MpaB family protein n=1 Tax=Robertkochia aurantiaca TaxID=2873700 RepID=UPI001CCE530B|nr:oxygenase MpaB family protein [Robertkochia sp. 3YJGBD-33]